MLICIVAILTLYLLYIYLGAKRNSITSKDPRASDLAKLATLVVISPALKPKPSPQVQPMSLGDMAPPTYRDSSSPQFDDAMMIHRDAAMAMSLATSPNLGPV